MRRAFRFASLALAAAVILVSASAETVASKLVPASRGPYFRFGVVCAVDGDTAAVGDVVGRVVAFRRTGEVWSEWQTIASGDGVASAGPGVAVDGTTLAVGGTADGTDGPAGPAVHVFAIEGSTWVRRASLRAADTASVSAFTGPLALEGDTLVVGDAYADGATTESGAVWVFTRSGISWTEQAKLVASDGRNLDRFGCAVALDGDTLMIGALGVDDLGNAAGAAYVFVRSGTTWTEQAKLIPSTARTYDQAGTAVGLAGDRAFIGAEFDDDYGQTSGSVFVFERSGTSWGQSAVLAAPDAHALVYFGSALAAEGDRLLVGALGHDGDGAYAGRAYLYAWDQTLGQWVLGETLVSPEAAAGDQFGYAAAMRGGTILVGASGDKDLGDDTGSAWAFRIATPTQATNQAFIPTSVEVVFPAAKSSGPAKRAPGLYARGILDTGPDEVDLTAGGSIVVGSRRYDVPSLTRSANGRVFVHDDGTVRYVVTVPPSGSSRATFALTVEDDLRGVVEPNEAVTLGWSGKQVDAAATVGLEGGKFRLTAQPWTLDADTMLCLAATARCIGPGRDSFSFTVRWGGDARTLSEPPAVTVRFGPTFGEVLDPARFRLRRGVWQYSDPKAKGVWAASFFPKLCKATFRSRRCSLGEFAPGLVPLDIYLAADEMERSVSVRARLRRKTLRY